MNGEELHALAKRLFPICRSITGPGVRETLSILQKDLPLTIHSVASGTQVLDWEVPLEWTPRSAWIEDLSGRRIIDFATDNLHLLQYSENFSGRVSREELAKHLFSLPDQPDAIPYKTSYYQKQWGFCVSENQKKLLSQAEYNVQIDTSLDPGQLDYGELVIAGRDKNEILLSTHICHPSLANDNLSGIVVAHALARQLLQNPLQHTVRILFIPGTIGAITWLALNRELLPKIKHGLVLTGLGAGGTFHYKKTRSGNASIDLFVEHYLRKSGIPHCILPFSPYGYDERQFNSPGINLPMGCFTRATYASYPEYHTSRDNLEFIQPQLLEESALLILRMLQQFSSSETYVNLVPEGEPQLGRRNLYAADSQQNLAILWVLNQSDGHHSLLDISIRSGIALPDLETAADRLCSSGLLRKT